MKKILFLLIFIFSSINSFAGRGAGDISGGGFGVLKRNQVFLLDFEENGVSLQQNHPTISDLKPNLFLSQFKKLPFSESLKNEIALSLLKMQRQDPVLASASLQALNLLNWVFVNSDLVLINPEDTPIRQNLVQVAVRKPTQVYINKQFWKMMPFQHQVGLVLHEILIAISNPALPEIRVRQYIGQFFSNSIFQNPPEDIYRLIALHLPTINSLKKRAPALVSFDQKFYADEKQHIKYDFLPSDAVVLDHDWTHFNPLMYYDFLSTVSTNQFPLFPKITDPILFPWVEVIERDDVSWSNIQESEYFSTLDNHEKNWTNLCARLSDSSVQAINVNSYRLRMQMRDLKNHNLPNLEWKLVSQTDYQLRRLKQNQGCLPGQLVELKWLHQAMRQFALSRMTPSM